MLNVDTVVTSLSLGIVALGFMWWVCAARRPRDPNKRQAFVELLIDFIDVQVKTYFMRPPIHCAGRLTVFLWSCS
jgi:F-type H+-transporting ATPase subunit a